MARFIDCVSGDIHDLTGLVSVIERLARRWDAIEDAITGDDKAAARATELYAEGLHGLMLDHQRSEATGCGAVHHFYILDAGQGTWWRTRAVADDAV